jgi:hypothetical protein
MFSAELEYWLNNAVEPRSASRRRFAHVRNLYIGGQFRDVAFCAVRDDEKQSAARDLINDRYGWRGYGSDHSIPVDIQHTTFVAELDRKVVGTITLGVDSGDGLTIDSTFADVTDEFRSKPGVRVCELTKLAFDCNVRSKEVLAGLFHLAFIYGTSAKDCTDLFIEVNPRHARFYEMMLGFCRVGLSRINASVGAPAQLMRLQVDVIRRNIQEMAGNSGAGGGHSLYPYFFSLDDEARIRRSLGLSHPSTNERLEIFADSATVPNQDTRPSLAVAAGLKSAA